MIGMSALKLCAFKFSPTTIRRLGEIVEAHASRHTLFGMRGVYTKTDCLRKLINDEYERIDAAARAANAAAEGATKEKSKSKKKPKATSPISKKGKKPCKSKESV